MGWRDLFRFGATAAPASPAPRASIGTTVTVHDLNDPALGEHLRGGALSGSGAVVTVEAAMRVAAAYRALHILAGVCGNLPIDVLRRVGERERLPAVDHPLRAVLRERPNAWQTPSEFRKMLTAHAVLRGNGYGLKITARGRVIEIWPLNPDRMTVRQNADMSVSYRYTRPDGSPVELAPADVLHLRGLSWDGVTGVGVLRHAREALGLALQQEAAGARLYRQGVLAGVAFKHPNELSPKAYDRLKDDLETQYAGAENAHKLLLLEGGLDFAASPAMTAADAQFLEGRKFSRSDIAMFFGVPPFLLGDTEKSTSWGSGIEQQNIGFLQYTVLDWLTMWEQALAGQALSEAERREGLYVRIDARGFLRGDLKTRQGFYQTMLQWGVYSPDDVRALEDENPRPDGGGGVYYDPPNTAGGAGGGGEPKSDPEVDDDRPPPADR